MTARSLSQLVFAFSPERVVEAELDHLEVTAAAREGVDHTAWEHDGHGEVPMAESDEVVLALEVPVPFDRPFDAAAEQPAADTAAAGGAERGARRHVRDREAVAVANPAAAGLAVEQPVVGGPAEPGGHCRDPVGAVGRDHE